MPPNFGLPPLGMQPFGATPEQEQPADPLNVTPEQLARMFAPYDQKQAALRRQMAQADALRSPSDYRYSTGVGGGFGAIADTLNGFMGGRQARDLAPRQEALNREEAQAGAEKFGLLQAIEKQKNEREMAFKKGLHDDTLAAKGKAASTAASTAAAKAAEKKQDDLTKREIEMMNHYVSNPETKALQAGYSSFSQITKAPKTGTGDLSRIYGLAKLYDPSGRVTDSDAEMAASTGGLPGRLNAIWKDYTATGKLSDDARAQIDAEAKRLMTERFDAFKPYQNSLRNSAKTYGLAPERVVVPMGFDAWGGTPQQAVSAAGVDLGKQRVTMKNHKTGEVVELDAEGMADAAKDGFEEVDP